MSVGYENIFRFPPYTKNWRAITGEWPDVPLFEHRGQRAPWRERIGARRHARRTSTRPLASAPSASQSEKCAKECGNGQ
jgi:hypothetical protein